MPRCGCKDSDPMECAARLHRVSRDALTSSDACDCACHNEDEVMDPREDEEDDCPPSYERFGDVIYVCGWGGKRD